MPARNSIVNLRLALLCGLAVALSMPSGAAAAELHFTAGQLFERGASENLRLSAGGEAVMLMRGTLHHDDGPAAGYSYQANVEELKDGVSVRKTLLIDDPRADGALLLLAPGGEINATINGERAELSPPEKSGNYWETRRLDPALLRAGPNEIVLSGKGKLWIARDDEFAAGAPPGAEPPNRSAKSSDGGRTWSDRSLGAGGNIDGEYYVRLFLDQHVRLGRLVSEVIDARNPDGRIIAPPAGTVGPVKFHAGGEDRENAKIELRVRSGTTFAFSAETWSDWQLLPENVLEKPAGRFLQVEISLSTSDPRTTPRLTGLSIEISTFPEGGWTGDVKLAGQSNPRIVRTSIPFRYEPADQPLLARLRREQRLDEVVKGAASELELIERLAAWSAGTWERGHLAESYPPWDALAILKAHEDGTPVGGFCQQHSLVFLQACESFGLVGRIVSIGAGDLAKGRPAFRGGHETVELWSNQFGKWIHVDGDMAWYFVDSDSRRPLSLLELHERQSSMLAGREHGGVDVVEFGPRKRQWSSLADWPPFIELRMIPRSDFLSAPRPLPLNQGMRGWFWTGHLVWTDVDAAARPIYSQRIARRGNWEWTAGGSHVYLEGTPRPGVVRVHIDGAMPHLDHYLATIGDGEPRRVGTAFEWRLAEGGNRLAIVPVNTHGRRGGESNITVRWNGNQARRTSE